MAVKREIEFEDLDGQPIKEEWWFRLDEADAIRLDFAYQDDPEGYLRGLLATKNNRELMEVFQQLLFAAVGKRVNNRLVKSADLREEFEQCGAFAQLFSELIRSDDAGAEFFMSIMPKHVQEKMAAHPAPREYTDEELLKVSDEEFYKAAGTTKSHEMDERFLLLAMRRRNAPKAA